MQKITIILGPTSSGKTSKALEMCKTTGGEIISADSRQIFKHMDIGTGKSPVDFASNAIKIEKNDEFWLVDGVKVWGYDLTTPDIYFSAYDWATWALEKAKQLLEQGKTLYLVGGTGFYIDLFTARVKPAQIKPDFSLRETLKNESLENLQKQLTSLNLEAYKNIDTQNPVRLMRAIEKELGEKTATPLPYLTETEFEYIYLTHPREFLYSRADQWLEKIWENGLIEETKNLISLGFGETPALNGIVYKSAKAFITGATTEESAKERAKFDLHAYIRRQESYFKRIPGVVK